MVSDCYLRIAAGKGLDDFIVGFLRGVIVFTEMGKDNVLQVLMLQFLEQFFGVTIGQVADPAADSLF